jgi:DNA repair protein RadA/Sms
LQLANCDIFANVVGGVRIMEPAADLGVGMSIASSFRDRPLLQEMMMVGEIGLTGEVRPVNRIEERLREGAKMGFTRCILPQANLSGNSGSHIKEMEKDLKITGVTTLAEALDIALK